MKRNLLTNLDKPGPAAAKVGAIRLGWMRLVMAVVLCLVGIDLFGQVNIIPIRTDVSGFATWTDTDVAGTTYLQLLKATSVTITPAMDFDSYTSETLNFKARTYGGVNATENVITVSISTDNGSSWTVLGTRTPGSTTLTAMTQFDLSSYNGTQVKIKLSVAGTLDGVGAGIDDIDIKGVLNCTPPTVTSSASPATICNGSSSTLTASGADTYLWSTGGNTASISVSPASTTTYTVTGTTSGCNATSTVTVTVNTATITASASPASICNGNSSSLTAAGGASYVWSTTETANPITVSPAATATYTVTGTAANTCTGTATVSVTVNSVPTAPTAGTNTPSQTQIVWDWSDVAGATGYQWNTTNTYPGAGINTVASSTYTQTGLTCATAYTLYVWTYNSCGYSAAPVTLTQSTSTCSSFCIDEDFVDFSDWTNSGTASDATHCAPNDECRALGTGNNIVSPPVDNPYQMTFMQDASSGGNGSTATIQYKIGAGGTWTSCYSFTVSTTESVKTVDLTNVGGVNLSLESQVYFRFNSTFNTWYLDDVQVSCSAVSNTITTGTVSSPPFTVTCSTGASGTVAFTSTDVFNAGNVYTAQLSNASGSFASPVIIGTLTSTANSGTISITIPAGTETSTGYLIRVVSSSPVITGTSSNSFSITLSDGPCSCFEIESILVDACDGSAEGRNEMFRFVVGGNAIDTSNITVDWPNPSNLWLGLCQNSTTASIVAAINATLTLPGQILEPSGGVIPAGAQVMFFTNTNFNYAMFDFSGLNYTLYAIFQCPDNTPGHFVNHNSTNPTNRTLTMTVSSCGSDAVTYNAYYIYDGDGATVDFDYPGNPTYSDTGQCTTVPIFDLPVDLLFFTAVCTSKNVYFVWSTATEINNAYFTIEAADVANGDFVPVVKVDGAGNSNEVRNYSVEVETSARYFRLKQTDFDGKYSYSDVIAVDCEDNQVQVFPTLASEGEQINIIGEISSVRVFDSMSREIDPEILDNKVCCLEPGMYFFVINQKWTYKVIVQ